MEQQGVLGAFGIVDRAPMEISEALLRLNMSHTLAWRDGVRHCSTHVYGTAKEQPVWPVVVDSVRTLSKMKLSGHYIYFVVDSRAAVCNTNMSSKLWPEKRDHETFTESLATELLTAQKVGSYLDVGWKLEQREPSLMDYVNTAVKPSQLTEFQTLTCKINPYSLRKEVVDLCILYMAGAVGGKVLKAKLESSYKLAPVQDLMKHPVTQELRTAVLEVKNDGLSVESVCKARGFQSFEILYFIKAAETRSAATAGQVKGKKRKPRS